MLDLNRVKRARSTIIPDARARGVYRAIACACILLATTFAGVGQDASPPSKQQSTEKVALPTAGNPRLDKNALRRKQLAEDSDRLYALAVALKAEVDKTNKDVLSLAVIRKADEIEKLAHNVKEEMKRTPGGN